MEFPSYIAAVSHGIIWALRRLVSPATHMFFQNLIEANTKTTRN